jgi:hypothetical protein
MPESVMPFRIEVPDDDLMDLRHRLRRTRWPEAATVADWSQGVPLSYLQDLCFYWAEDYQWRDRERHLNRFPQFRTVIDGIGIHFIHVTSPEPGAMPLVLTHGWPGSVTEFMDVIGPLTDPVAHGGDAGDAFHLVVPSLPGFGFSDRPVATGWGRERIADAWAVLMARLGYDRYGAQGGDWGASVSTGPHWQATTSVRPAPGERINSSPCSVTAPHHLIPNPQRRTGPPGVLPQARRTNSGRPAFVPARDTERARKHGIA